MSAASMNATTGRALGSLDSIRQSIGKILTTPIGSCTERREFGSLLPDLIDAPLNELTRMQAVAASAAAILKWEPRIRLTRLSIEQPSSNYASLLISLEASATGNGQPISLQLPITLGGLRV